ncbi:MAG: hypothetical protein RLZZ253_1797 [Verrucomicrobiota bacterium]
MSGRRVLRSKGFPNRFRARISAGQEPGREVESIQFRQGKSRRGDPRTGQTAGRTTGRTAWGLGVAVHGSRAARRGRSRSSRWFLRPQNGRLRRLRRRLGLGGVHGTETRVRPRCKRAIRLLRPPEGTEDRLHPLRKWRWMARPETAEELVRLWSPGRVLGGCRPGTPTERVLNQGSVRAGNRVRGGGWAHADLGSRRRHFGIQTIPLGRRRRGACRSLRGW